MTTKDLVIKLYESLDCRYCRMSEECDRSYHENGFPCDRCRDQILQELDRIEKLEKENKHLKLFYDEILDSVKGFNNSEV